MLAAYDPFHMICGTPDAVTMISWPGAGPGRAETVAVRDLGPGTHLITNAGHAYPAGPGDPAAEPKAAHFGQTSSAPRACPPTRRASGGAGLGRLAHPGAAGDGLDPADLAAYIIVRHELPDGRVHGTTSVTLVALADDAVRYDFQPHPAALTAGYPVPLCTADPGGPPPPPPPPRSPSRRTRSARSGG